MFGYAFIRAYLWIDLFKTLKNSNSYGLSNEPKHMKEACGSGKHVN